MYLSIANWFMFQATDWSTNAAGHKFSHSFGYGLMDASAMVSLARKWFLMPDQGTCFPPSPYDYKEIPAGDFVTIEMEVDCSNVRIMEHVRKS